MNSIPPQESQSISSRSLELTRNHVPRAQAVSRSLWLQIRPRHRVLRLVFAQPIIGLMLALLILMLLMLGFALVAAILLSAVPKAISQAQPAE